MQDVRSPRWLNLNFSQLNHLSPSCLTLLLPVHPRLRLFRCGRRKAHAADSGVAVSSTVLSSRSVAALAGLRHSGRTGRRQRSTLESTPISAGSNGCARLDHIISTGTLCPGSKWRRFAYEPQSTEDESSCKRAVAGSPAKW